MSIHYKKGADKEKVAAHLYLFPEKANLKDLKLSASELDYAKAKIKEEKKYFTIPRAGECIGIVIAPSSLTTQSREDLRRQGASFCDAVNAAKENRAKLVDKGAGKAACLEVLEGMALANYQFLKYKNDAEKLKNSLHDLFVESADLDDDELFRFQIGIEAVYIARDLVNEPQSYLSAVQLTEEIEGLALRGGFKAEIFNKAKIESLKMGGLLAVNKGSNIPPTFSILEWKPENAKNKKPIILVGKGVVYDTGGLSLKPTPNSMDYMKSDMAGAAAVIASVYAAAAMKLPVHVVALVPATDNRPGQDAYAPGDVIEMYNGMTVEVLNTDAEGRMILADALSYAAKFKPELVMDFATLTGAAAAAIGQYGIVCMGTASDKIKKDLSQSADEVYERLAELPFWDEYKDLLKSEIADIKNIGGPVGGAITAGKFLEHFTSYPWMHFDIAGPAFLKSKDSYRGKNGTGSGVRFILNYLKKRGGIK